MMSSYHFLDNILFIPHLKPQMPPKPWLSKTGPPREDVSAIIQSNPTFKQQTPKLSPQMSFVGPNTAQQSMNSPNSPINSTTNPTAATNNPLGTTGLGTTSGYGGSGSGSMGGYGSSYGGYGGSSGGYGSSSYGSSYGGYGGSSYGMGGYGSSYGMGGYGSSYGMGGYGRMGMMAGGDPNKPNMVMNTLMTLESLGFLIGSFCQIGRSLDQNIEGLHLFFNSFKNLFKKIYEGVKNLGSWMGEKTKNSLMGILNFIKTYVLFMKHEDANNRMKSLRIVINVCVAVLVFTLYPQIKKLVRKAA